jgi:threonine aldolase
VRASAFDEETIRFCTNLDVTDEDIDEAIARVQQAV